MHYDDRGKILYFIDPFNTPQKYDDGIGNMKYSLPFAAKNKAKHGTNEQIILFSWRS